MQHIHINDPAGCTIVNVNSDGTEQAQPRGEAARTCPQCALPTWRRTPTCMHCGHDRYARARLIAKTGAVAAAAMLVIFHPLIRG